MKMKKMYRLFAVSLAGLLLTSCQAKNAIVSESAFKESILPKIEALRVENFQRNCQLTINRNYRNLDTMKCSQLQYSVDMVLYTKITDRSTIENGVALTVSKTTMANGTIEVVIDELTGEEVYSEKGTKTTTAYSVGAYSYEEDEETKYKYVIKQGETELLTSDFNPKDEAVTDNQREAFVNQFFTYAGIVDVFNEIKTIYNGYIDEIKTTLDDASCRKEILSAKTNYIYRYLNAEGYHEFQISKELSTIDRVGLRQSVDSKEATTTALSGFES